MKYGYYIKIDKSFNLTDALALLSCQKHESDCHAFTRVYNGWKLKHERDYLVIHDEIFEAEYCKSDDLKSIISGHSGRYWKWTELKLKTKNLGEI